MRPSRPRSLASAIVLAAALPAAPVFAQDVKNGFDPTVDAPTFANNGDYASEGGDCFGMSLLAIDHYLARIRASGLDPKNADAVVAAPRPSPKPVTQRAAEGDPAEEEAAGLLQADAERKDPDAPTDHLSGPRDPEPLAAALDRIRRTGVPEVFFLYAPDGDGHATVLYGSRGGTLVFYDPNYPGETVAWPFEPAKGLGRHPKADDDPDFYGRISRVSSVPFARLDASHDVAAIRSLCTAGSPECTDKFPTVEASLERGPDGGVVAVTGKVGRGARVVDGEDTAPPAKVWLRLDGRLQEKPAVLDDDRSFRFELPASLRGRQDLKIQVVATTGDGAIAGYGAPLPPSSGARAGIVGVLGGVGSPGR